MGCLAGKSRGRFEVARIICGLSVAGFVPWFLVGKRSLRIVYNPGTMSEVV